MDPTRFDRLAITVGQRTTRRTALAALAALGLTGLVAEEAGAICKSPGEECHRNDACCSGVCRNKNNRCKCPQRLCCQCVAGDPVPCTYVTSVEACEQRCLKRTDIFAAETFFPLPGIETTLCEGTQCRHVDCVPT
jgi:hypothetical protein